MTVRVSCLRFCFGFLFFRQFTIFHFCLCCLAGVFFENNTISHFVCVALRAAFFDIHDFPLCLCCLAGGLDFEKSVFFYLYNFFHIAKLLNLLGFEAREYARTLSFEK